MAAGSSGFTDVVTNETVSILEEYSIRLLAIKCKSTSSSAGQIVGNNGVPYRSMAASVAIDIPIGESLTIESEFGNLAGYSITAPAGCTLNIIGSTG